MTATNILQRNGRLTRRDAAAATHLFTIGQAVRLKGGYRRSALPADIYHITGTLPPSGGSPQYRNDDERHERVMTQDTLEPVHMSSADEGATLIEKTFGNQIKPAANGSASLDKGKN
ncbi:hypothetical protein PZN02_005331 [Sinorhizobium garamanticum]|uniref:Uncharacterized protein n=1 Tax=Sinorhizobium garamanticum TaxID=680247 RepID=A0ABY8DGG2_9HYPH|nr:hypothetical protein [Sinorhizobium garamanticum]WEX89990.1 hypothetical protein PZN02_005331 [Sinorhizobium garamanticum]